MVLIFKKTGSVASSGAEKVAPFLEETLNLGDFRAWQTREPEEGDGSMSPHDKELQEGAERNRSGFRGFCRECTRNRRGRILLPFRNSPSLQHGPACRDEVDRDD